MICQGQDRTKHTLSAAPSYRLVTNLHRTLCRNTIDHIIQRIPCVCSYVFPTGPLVVIKANIRTILAHQVKVSRRASSEDL